MGAPTPPIIIMPFGEGNAGSITLPIPVPSQLPANPGFASFTDGFPTDTAGAGSLPPRWQDMQGILYTLSANWQALTGGQFWPFNATWAAANGGYALAALVANTTTAGFWANSLNGNTNNPDTSPAATSGWVPLVAYGIGDITGLTNANVTLTAAQASFPIIVLSGALTGNVQIIFPTWAKQWLVINETTGNFVVTCKTASGTGVAVPQAGAASPALLYGDGTNIQAILSGFASGSWSATLSGPYTSNPSGTIYWSRMGSQVNIWTQSDINGTATNSANGITISGLPSQLSPTSPNQRQLPCNYVNMGGLDLAGNAAVGLGDIFVSLLSTASIGGSTYMQANGNFQSGQSAGLHAGWSISYSL